MRSCGEISGHRFVDRWRQPLSWFDERHGELLSELFDPFCRVHNDERLRESLVLALHWYRHCNTNSSGKEGSLVLGMAALDLLSALIVVGRFRSMSAQEHDRLSAAEKLRPLLEALDVSADIPSRYAALTAFAEKNDKSDSCEALAKLRNGFVHANEKRRNVAFGSAGRAAVSDAWQLSLWYQGTGVAPPVATSRKLQKSDNREMRRAGRARTMEQPFSSVPGRAACALREDDVVSKNTNELRTGACRGRFG